MEGQYVIVGLRAMDFFKDENGKIKYYDTEEEACNICGIYELEHNSQMKKINKHEEKYKPRSRGDRKTQ
jgi:ribosomal protein S24E